jgi:hypothetical protein
MVKEGKDNGHMVVNWAPDLVALFANRFYEGMNLLGAWQTIPVGALHAIVETVRNKVLQFVLHCEGGAGRERKRHCGGRANSKREGSADLPHDDPAARERVKGRPRTLPHLMRVQEFTVDPPPS